MSPLIRRTLSKLTAAVIPAGVTAVLAFQAPAASAAVAARTVPAPVTSSRSGGRQQAPAPSAATKASDRQLAMRRAARLRAYAWAAHQTGHPYVWGGTGPGFDCSGLVMMAYRHAGIRLPRTTYAMLASPLLHRVRHPRMGDLAFYSSSHVELFRRWGYTFGAHDSRSRVGIIHYGHGWTPKAFYRVR